MQPGLYEVDADGEAHPLHNAAGVTDIDKLHNYLYAWDISPMQKTQQRTHQWRMTQWPELTPLQQLSGTAVEVSELLEMEIKGEHYDKDWCTDEKLKEEIGDVMIYLMGYASLRGFDIAECIDAADDKNVNRDWDKHMEAP